jgi:glutathione S-transferase
MNRLTYFNVRGRVEPIRFLFEAKKVPYEFVAIEMAEWPALKAKYQEITPLGQLPLLEVVKDGNVEFNLSQSLSIARYIAAQLGLDGGANVCLD